jgi:hypothetical protein
MKKKVITMALALTLALSMTGTAFAADDYNIAYPRTSSDSTTEVKYEVSQNYTVTLPGDVAISTEGVDKTVSASSVLIANGKTLNVKVSSSQYDSSAATYKLCYEGSNVPYTIKKGNAAIVNNATVLSVASGAEGLTGSETLTFATTDENIQKATKAGNHTDTLTFTVSVTDKTTNE